MHNPGNYMDTTVGWNYLRCCAPWWHALNRCPICLTWSGGRVGISWTCLKMTHSWIRDFQWDFQTTPATKFWRHEAKHMVTKINFWEITRSGQLNVLVTDSTLTSFHWKSYQATAGKLRPSTANNFYKEKEQKKSQQKKKEKTHSYRETECSEGQS